MNTLRKPIPIAAVLDAINEVLVRKVGSQIDLEISERDCETYSDGTKKHRIEINLTIEDIINPKKNNGGENNSLPF